MDLYTSLNKQEMIKANELRIGNWVLNEGIPNITTSIYVYNPTNGEENILIRMGVGQGVNIKELEPILLTKNLLFKCGFKAVTTNIYNKLRDIDCFELKYVINGNECPLFLVFYNGCYNHIIPSYNTLECVFSPIKYLHQLQNLHISLSGEELNVNL